MRPELDSVSIGGPEDKLVYEALCSLRGVNAQTKEWETKSWQLPAGPRGREPGRDSTNASVNHWSVAAWVAAMRGEPRGAGLTGVYLAEPNDLWMMECCVALAVYNSMNLLAFTGIRDALRRRKAAPEVVEKLTAELRQVHALSIALLTDAGDLARSWALMAGPRGGSTTKPRPGTEVRGMREYMVLRAAGWSDAEIRTRALDGARIVQQVSGDDPDRAGTMIATLTGHLAESLQEDAAPAWAAFRSGGYAELAERCIVGGRGTRMPLRWRRTTGGVVAVLERNTNSAKGPRLVEMWREGEPYPTRWPYGARKTGGLVEGGADIDTERGRVTAECEGLGGWSSTLPHGDVLFDVASNRTGVRSLLPSRTPTDPPQPPDEPETPAPPAPGEPRKGDSDRARTIGLCLLGIAAIILLARLGGCS